MVMYAKNQSDWILGWDKRLFDCAVNWLNDHEDQLVIGICL